MPAARHLYRTTVTCTLASSIVANNCPRDVSDSYSTVNAERLPHRDHRRPCHRRRRETAISSATIPARTAEKLRRTPPRPDVLLTGSPAIDTGTNPNSLVYDQRGRGFPREAGAPSTSARSKDP